MAEIQMNFAQVFGDSRNPSDEVADVDVVSAIEFDETGDYIAAGDRGGRIIIFEREEKTGGRPTSQSQSLGNSGKRNSDYGFLTEFQSHEPEFDYLKSLEIEEKINKIKWLRRQNGAHFLLSTNDKTIKLWKIYEKKIKVTSNINKSAANASQLSVPSVDTRETAIAQIPRRVFSNAHAYHINSISLNSDGETFISSDDLRINLWNTSISDQSFNIVDIKPSNMEELTEVITSAEFHPSHCNVFMYSSSKGTIKLADMRASALCDKNAKVFEEPEDPVSKSFFSEIISSISDIKFSRDGRYMVSRDYMTLKVWDVNMESRPVKTIHIHDHLKSKLCDLYENDCIFDKFECSMSHDSNLVLTGSYHNYFSIYDKNSKNELHLEATKAAKLKRTQVKKGGKGGKSGDINPDALDFGKKILHVAWHPHENLIAIGASNNLYIFNA